MLPCRLTMMVQEGEGGNSMEIRQGKGLWSRISDCSLRIKTKDKHITHLVFFSLTLSFLSRRFALNSKYLVREMSWGYPKFPRNYNEGYFTHIHKRTHSETGSCQTITWYTPSNQNTAAARLSKLLQMRGFYVWQLDLPSNVLKGSSSTRRYIQVLRWEHGIVYSLPFKSFGGTNRPTDQRTDQPNDHPTNEQTDMAMGAQREFTFQ